jgi:UDP-glucose 4-epimerase
VGIAAEGQQRRDDMRALVTGGAGFIGSHLCDALVARGDEVWCVDNLHLGREENVRHLAGHERFHFHKFDVLDRDALDRLFADARFDTVFHLAANSDIQRGVADSQVDLELTFLSTFEVLQAMLRHDVRRVFFASTSAIFGDTDDLLHETYGPLQPVSFYGAAKLAAEAYLSVYVHSFGFRAWVLRFPNVVGERATHGAVHDFIERLRRDPSHLAVLGDGSQTKPYLYVQDLVRAILLVVQQATEPLAVYHVAGEGMTSVREMAEIVVEEMGLAGIPIEYSGGKVGWKGDVPRFCYDTQKIRQLGFVHQYDSTEAVRVAVRAILGKSALPDGGDRRKPCN